MTRFTREFPKSANPLRGLPGWLILSIFLTNSLSANVVGTNTQNFNAAPTAADHVTVYSARTAGAGNFGLGLFINSAVNTLPYFKDGDDGEDSKKRSRAAYNDSLLGTEFSAAYGILPNLDLNFGLPGVVYQDVKDEDESHGEFASNGITAVRGGVKWRIFGTGMLGTALVVSANAPTTKGDPYEGKDSAPTYNTELVGDLVFFERLELAVNAGYRWKSPGKGDKEAPVQPFKNHMVGSGALAYRFAGTSAKWVTELFGSAPTSSVEDASGRHSTTLEAITGIKYLSKDSIAYHFGGGSELRHSVASPDWRLYAGVNWVGKVGGFTSPRPSIARAAASVAPAKVSKPEEVPDEIIVIRDVLFEFDSAELKHDDSFRALDVLVKALKKQPTFTKLIIEGHTCALGSSAYNRSLSKRRAAAIRQALIKHYGTDGAKVFTVGKGEAYPIAKNDTEANRSKNRRVEFKIFRDDPKELTQAAAQRN